MAKFSLKALKLPPMPTSPPPHSLGRAEKLQIGILVLFAVLTHFAIGHLLIASYGLVVWGIKSIAVMRQGKNPPKLLIMLLTILSFVFILLLYGGWNGQKAGISFLVLLVSLKYLESNTLRDYYLVCLILLFLAACSFLFNASLPNIILVTAYTIAILSLMLRMSDPNATTSTSGALNAAAIMLKALPLAILLFFFFPRIQGDFGFIPSQDEKRRSDKLNDSLVAGDFASSAFNNTKAFEVSFDGDIPSKGELYWRVKVMDRERQFQWEMSPLLAKPNPLPQSNSPAVYNYQVVHQPSSDKYLPYLDYALNPKLGIQLPNYSVINQSPEDGIFSYQGIASANPHLDSRYQVTSSVFLTTTSVPKARSLALLNTWRSNANRPEDLVNQALAYFRNNEFSYTVRPPLLEQNPIEEFLFETRAGYCEHYASSFTILMRWLGIPSRVVIGYQGGTVNEVGNYIEVKYSNAHAWSEVWINDRWNRVDPTAAVSPERIELGMEALMAMLEADGLDEDGISRALSDYLNPSAWQRFKRKAVQSWDNVGFQWNKWVVNYNSESQKQMLSKLGFKHQNSLYTLVAIIIASTLILLTFYFWQLIPKPIKRSELELAYLNFITKFKRLKINKRIGETPQEFADRTAALLPESAGQIREISNDYQQLRYTQSTASLDSLRQKIKQFKPKKSK